MAMPTSYEVQALKRILAKDARVMELMRVKNTVKVSMWRACNNLFPMKANLSKRNNFLFIMHALYVLWTRKQIVIGYGVVLQQKV